VTSLQGKSLAGDAYDACHTRFESGPPTTGATSSQSPARNPAGTRATKGGIRKPPSGKVLKSSRARNMQPAHNT